MTGEKVFLDYDQQALDAAYNQAAYAPNREQLLARHASNSAAMRARIGSPLRLAYGEAAVERAAIESTRPASMVAAIEFLMRREPLKRRGDVMTLPACSAFVCPALRHSTGLRG